MSERHPLFRSRRRLPPELEKAQQEIQELGRRYGLKFCPVIFEMCDYDEINMIASYGGFPTRYPHWRYGMEYLQMQKGYEYGLQKIYEMVINTDPSYAYLLDNNTMVDQKLVMAHVLGHVDFFTNNAWFAHTNRKMLDQMANHASRIRRYIDRHGADTVEQFIDMCLSIEDLIDPYSPYMPRPLVPESDELEDLTTDEVFKLPVQRRYMDKYVNPPEYIAQQRQQQEEHLSRQRGFPREPERDVMGFILRYGKLSRWQQDVLSIVRDEAYYFAPQAMTKVMNEGWACVAAHTPVFTERGLLSMEQVVSGEARQVSDGTQPQDIYDQHIIPSHPTITIRTRRGFTLTGSNNHRILGVDGWVRLDALSIGDSVQLCGGAGLWPEAAVPVRQAKPAGRAQRDAWVRRGGASTAAAVQRHASAEAVRSPRRCVDLQCPESVTEELGAFLGCLIADGHISQATHTLGLTTHDAARAARFASLAFSLFGLHASIEQDEERLTVLLRSEALASLLAVELGMPEDPRAARVPEAILRSPAPAVRAFLRACFGAAGERGVRTSEAMSQQLQLLLLSDGILSTRQQADGCWSVHIDSPSGQQDRCDEGALSDEIVSIAHGVADVYDISVRQTHRYAAAGLINHNSFWHTRLMTKHILDDSEVITYADHHSGTVSMRPGQINPYKIGLELFRDIEERWNKGQFGKEWLECSDVARKRDWDTGAGLGMEKLFEVRASHNDVTFIDTFLTEDFVRKVGLFTYEFDASANHYVVDSREFKAVKDKLLFMLSNRGQPRIQVTNGNANNRGELELQHQHEGIDMQMDWAEPTLQNIARLWGRPVHLKTTIDKQEVTFHHDGEKFTVEGLKRRPAGRRRKRT